jgi:hypothetical protein
MIVVSWAKQSPGRGLCTSRPFGEINRHYSIASRERKCAPQKRERLKMGVSYTEGEKKRASVKKAKKGEGR